MAKDIDWDSLEKSIVKKAEGAVNGVLEDLKNEIDKNTPIDTRELLDNTKIKAATTSGNRVSGSVYNETEYAQYVEYGVGGKTYNYHKNKRIFYIGVGARMFTRAYDSLKDTITEKLKKAFNL